MKRLNFVYEITTATINTDHPVKYLVNFFMKAMIDKHEILRLLRENQQEFSERYTVRRIGIFGSVVRDKADSKSDVDIIVELKEPTFDHYMELKFRLEKVLDRPVDLVLADTLKPRLKPIIESEALYA